MGNLYAYYAAIQTFPEIIDDVGISKVAELLADPKEFIRGLAKVTHSYILKKMKDQSKNREKEDYMAKFYY